MAGSGLRALEKIRLEAEKKDRTSGWRSVAQSWYSELPKLKSRIDRMDGSGLLPHISPWCKTELFMAGVVHKKAAGAP